MKHRPGCSLLLLALLLAWLTHIFSSPSKETSFVTNDKAQQQRILLLTAHPDDECLFFGPTIRSLVRSGVMVFSLCLSVGNADGLGETRRGELQKSLRVLGIPPTHSAVVDHPRLQDNITQMWDSDLVAEVVRPYLRAHNITMLLTFDTHGISGHPNHISLPLGASHLLHSTTHLQLYTLKTVSVLLKYIGPLSHLVAKAQAFLFRDSSRPVFVANFEDYRMAWHAMRQHGSQLVWFRWLYVLFSRYMWVNEWVLV